MFFLTTLAVLIIVFYQLFVDKNYRFLNPKKFLQPQFLKGLLKGNRELEVNSWEELKNKNIFTSLVFLSPNKDKAALIREDNNDFILSISQGGENKTKEIVFNSLKKLNIIQWDKDNNRLYLAYLDEEDFWNIGIFNLIMIEENDLSEKIKPLVEKINFKGDKLTTSIEPISEKIVYPECDPNCHFVVFDLAKGTKNSISIVDETNEKNIMVVSLNFFDEKTEKIIYEIKTKDMAYIIDFSSYLWHYIYLKPTPDNLIEIKGIFVDSLGNKKLVAYSKLKRQTYLYDINDIGLKVIEDE